MTNAAQEEFDELMRDKGREERHPEDRHNDSDLSEPESEGADKDRYEFCWITDFPQYGWNEDEKKIDFSHNPFSAPNIEHEAFMALDPSDIHLLCGDLTERMQTGRERFH